MQPNPCTTVSFCILRSAALIEEEAAAEKCALEVPPPPVGRNTSALCCSVCPDVFRVPSLIRVLSQ